MVCIQEQIAKERKLAEERADVPHIWNLNEDPALTGKIVHLIKPGDDLFLYKMTL
jgi:hypothetical protein